MSAAITFDSIKPVAGSRLVVTGTFPANLVRGVKTFTFELTPTVHDRSTSIVDFSNASVNGVRLKGYLRLAPLGFHSGVKAQVGSLGRLGSWDNPSSAAYQSLTKAGELILAAMLSDDLVAQAALMNTKVNAQAEAQRLDDDIKREEQHLAELRAKRAAFPDLAGTRIDGSGLKLATTLIADGISYGEALVAATEIGKAAR